MLTAIEIDALLPRATTHKSTGVHKLRVYRENDGGSLYLIVYPSGGKAWEFRYKRAGKAQAVILGVYGTAPGKMGPKAARTERDRRKGSIASGLDPKSEKAINAEAQRDTLAAKQAAREQREAEKARAQVDTARLALTFRVVADAWVADGRADWSARTIEQVVQSLKDHVYPIIGDKPIGTIEPGAILDLIGGLVAAGKVETARRVRQRLDSVFEYAALPNKLPSNPVAIGKREINKRVKPARRANPEGNHPCVPVAEVPQLLCAMRSYVGTNRTSAFSIGVGDCSCCVSR